MGTAIEDTLVISKQADGSDDIQLSGQELLITLESHDRDALANNGRQFCMNFVAKTPLYASFANAGVEKAGGPMAYDPENPGVDPYALIEKKGSSNVKWKYRQQFRITKMI